jgi:hypothetical protein
MVMYVVEEYRSVWGFGEQRMNEEANGVSLFFSAKVKE